MTHAANLFRKLWKQLAKPTVRLSFDFPFSPLHSLKLYGKSLLYFIVGSLVPVGLFLLTLRFLPPDSQFARQVLLVPGAEGLILSVLSLATFVCGFGLQLNCMRQAIHKDGRRLRDLISFNLRSLQGSWLKAIGLGAVTFAVALVAEQAMALVYTVPSSDPTADFIKTLGGSALYVMAGLAICGPIMEEIIFRGFLFNLLRSSVAMRFDSAALATVVAIFGSALIFGLMHMNLPALPFYMALGAVYAEAYRRSGTLFVPVIAHVLNNSMIVIGLIANQ